VGFEAKNERFLIKLGHNKWSVSFHEIVSCEISSDGDVEIWASVSVNSVFIGDEKRSWSCVSEAAVKVGTTWFFEGGVRVLEDSKDIRLKSLSSGRF